MNNRHRRVERLKKQEIKQPVSQLIITSEQAAIAIKEISLMVSRIIAGAGQTLINISKEMKERWK